MCSLWKDESHFLHAWRTSPRNPHLYACNYCGVKGMHTQAEADQHLAQHVHVHLNAK
ncbi:hypothetical protein T492DRAFT_861779 [Pavlovales sp. CCMP2436]|nr:hypothetical protein T492DRAFT_861779 [Pavlovales sp. CCMP2436]